jgi:hypothetical protein
MLSKSPASRAISSSLSSFAQRTAKYVGLIVLIFRSNRQTNHHTTVSQGLSQRAVDVPRLVRTQKDALWQRSSKSARINGRIRKVIDRAECLRMYFKTGALSHSVTLPNQ